MKIKWLFLIGFCFVFPALAKPAAKLLDARTLDSLESRRVVFSFDGPVNYKSTLLHNPERLVVDIKNARLDKRLTQLNVAELPIKNVRYAPHNGSDLRIVFDLKPFQSPKLFTLKPEAHYHYRLVIDWPAKSVAHTVSPLSPIEAMKPKLSIAQRNNLRDVIIVIDPGHGGKDSGAKGYRRTNEKDVVLAISKNLKQLIDRQAGMKAVLTRSSDYYIGLRQRIGFARKAHADLFVAVHADAFMRPESSGASVFALSARGASSEAARWLAEKENFSELGGVDTFSDKSYLVRSVLLDLSQTSTIQSSLQLGSEMLRNLGKISVLHSRRVEQARFVVLKSPDIPSVLVETGFISNPREEMNLRNPRYQSQLAQALLEGIKRYFWDAPPDGTLIAAARKAEHHTVKRGETLPILAAIYHVDQKYIKQLNFLRSNYIRPGQKLLIPPKTA